MQITSNHIERILIDYAIGIFGSHKKILPETNVSTELGLYDEDLWEMIEYAFDKIGLVKPDYDNPIQINISQKELNFRMLSEWIYSLVQDEMRRNPFED